MIRSSSSGDAPKESVPTAKTWIRSGAMAAAVGGEANSGVKGGIGKATPNRSKCRRPTIDDKAGRLRRSQTRRGGSDPS